jgi:hypothetical protein
MDRHSIGVEIQKTNGYIQVTLDGCMQEYSASTKENLFWTLTPDMLVIYQLKG